MDIHPAGCGYKPNYFETHFKDALKRYSYMQIVEVKVVFADRDVDCLARTIERVCRKESLGDGWIFLTDVQKAIRLRDGASGEAPLIEDRNADRTNQGQALDCKSRSRVAQSL